MNPYDIIIDDQYKRLSYECFKIMNQTNQIATSLPISICQLKPEDSLWRLRKPSPQDLIECTSGQRPYRSTSAQIGIGIFPTTIQSYYCCIT